MASDTGSSNRKESPILTRRSDDVPPVAYCSTYGDYGSQAPEDTGLPYILDSDSHAMIKNNVKKIIIVKEEGENSISKIVKNILS